MILVTKNFWTKLNLRNTKNNITFVYPPTDLIFCLKNFCDWVNYLLLNELRPR